MVEYELANSCKNIYVSDNNIFQDKIPEILKLFKNIRRTYPDDLDFDLDDFSNANYLIENKGLNPSSALFTTLWVKAKREWKFWSGLSYAKQLELLKDYVYTIKELEGDYDILTDDLTDPLEFDVFSAIKDLIIYFSYDKRWINEMYEIDDVVTYDKELEKFTRNPKNLYELAAETCKNKLKVSELRDIIPKSLIEYLKK